MKELAAWTVVFLMLSVAFRYGYQVYRKEISPAFSTWLIFLTGTSLSWITYMVAEDRDFQSGILNTVDVFVILIVVLSIVKWGKTSKTRFKPFEKYYLIGAGGIVVFWFVFQSAFISNLMVQLLMFIGYFPTIQNLVTEKRNIESFSVWIGVILAATIALYPAIVGGNLLAAVYVGRTIIMASVILRIMIFYTFSSKRMIKGASA